MSFPSLAADYTCGRISLDDICNTHRACTYLFRADFTSWREGIKKEALVVVDYSLTPTDGSLVVCCIDDVFRTKRFRLQPTPRLEDLDNPERHISLDRDCNGHEVSIRGVVTYVINDARSG